MSFWGDCRTFWGQSRHRFDTTGAVMPSSRYLGRALAAPLAGPREAKSILEVGPGTGAVTREIARRLIPGDRFDAVELNDQFVDHLRTTFDNDKHFAPYRSQIRLIHSAIQDIPGEGQYENIISGLPLNNFSVALIHEIFSAFIRLLKPGGMLSYFEYAMVRQLKSPFVGRAARQHLHEVGQAVGCYIDSYQVEQRQVLRNVPPAIVRHLRLKPVASAATLTSDSNKTSG